jgi:hypothetical protein
VIVKYDMKAHSTPAKSRNLSLICKIFRHTWAQIMPNLEFYYA